MATKVGFIGLGTMGKPIAINVVKSGFDLMVYDLRSEPVSELRALGAKAARSAKEVGQHGEIIEIVLVDDRQVQSALFGEDGVLSGAKPGTVLVIHSTIHPETVKRIAKQAQAKGVGVIDAELSGGARGAETQSLCFMVGGDTMLLEKCRPVLSVSGKNIFHMGELGMGAVAKLAHQVIVVGTMMSVAEGMLLAEKGGIDPKAFEKLVHVSAARSFIADTWLNWFKLLDKPGVEILHKCLIPAFDLAQEIDMSLPLTAVAQQMLPLRITGGKEQGTAAGSREREA